jgi:hypothetical protein
MPDIHDNKVVIEEIKSIFQGYIKNRLAPIE